MPHLPQRRCIHDENGNEDPVKAREAAIPRPTAALKRWSGGQDPRLAKKPRTVSKTRPTIDSARVPPATLPPAPRTKIEQPQHTEPVPPGGYIIDAMNHPNTSLGQDVRLASGIEKPKPILQQWDDIEDKPVSVSDASPTSHKDTLAIEVPLDQNPTTEQPAASSLVSPPASAHGDAEKSPPDCENPNPTPSSSSSRHSSRHQKHVQRYTPESGTARRASSSSIGDGRGEKNVAAMISLLNTDIKVQPETPRDPRDHEQFKADSSPEIVTDEASLKLIKELQAQEYGLRRRGRI